MKKALYLECYSGISGDMFVAALLDLGIDRAAFDRALKSLPLSGFETKVSQVNKSGIYACDFQVILEEDNHDHDMEYLHGQGDPHREHHHREHAHVHRGMKEIREIIEAGTLTSRARQLALKIFDILARAEAKAHRSSVDEVHFHEVGAVDSIVDIVGAAVCMDLLDVEEVILPVLYEGRGTVRCQHGILPIPVPAVTNIICQEKLLVKLTQVEGELVTPTGAAIAAAIRTSDQLPERYVIQKIGMGAGKRQYACPGILRAMVLEVPEKDSGEKERAQGDSIIKMETNIDDCTGETLGYVLEALMNQGAKDVHYVPAFMKKNRPGWILTVICREEDREALQEIIFKETTTIGIRYTAMDRAVLQREQRRIATPLGEADVKVCFLQGEEIFYPEYESVARLSRENHLPYKTAFDIIKNSCKEKHL